MCVVLHITLWVTALWLALGVGEGAVASTVSDKLGSLKGNLSSKKTAW